MIATWLRRVQQRCSNFPRGRPARSPGRSIHPQLEEFETRLTPAEVGANDFRISDMGPDGNAFYAVSDPAVAYNSQANKDLGQILLNATTFRFDGSDLMPGPIGAGAFWTGMVDYINGKSAQEVADGIQAAWDKL